MSNGWRPDRPNPFNNVKRMGKSVKRISVKQKIKRILVKRIPSNRFLDPSYRFQNPTNRIAVKRIRQTDSWIRQTNPFNIPIRQTKKSNGFAVKRIRQTNVQSVKQKSLLNGFRLTKCKTDPFERIFRLTF